MEYELDLPAHRRPHLKRHGARGGACTEPGLPADGGRRRIRGVRHNHCLRPSWCSAKTAREWAASGYVAPPAWIAPTRRSSYVSRTVCHRGHTSKDGSVNETWFLQAFMRYRIVSPIIGMPSSSTSPIASPERRIPRHPAWFAFHSASVIS